LLSFHGLPERHIRKGDPSGKHCLAKAGCCDSISEVNKHCYRAQCFATKRQLVKKLGLREGKSSMSFQSRLGRDPWLEPATDQHIVELARTGVRRLAVVCPGFVADCLETLEEIGLRAKESFLEAGGKDFRLVSCLNDHPAWLDALAAMLKRNSVSH